MNVDKLIALLEAWRCDNPAVSVVDVADGIQALIDARIEHAQRERDEDQAERDNMP